MRTNKGTFAAGNAGKPKGTPNKATRAVKSLLQDVFREHYTFDKIGEYMAELSGPDKLRLFANLLPYLIPKAADEPPTASLDDSPLDVTRLTDEELRYVAALQEKARRPPIEWVKAPADAD